MKRYCLRCMKELLSDGPCPYCGSNGPSETAPYCLKPGTVLLQRYLIGDVIGQGGFGITYVGLDLRLGIKVAVKEYFPTGYASRVTDISESISLINTRDEEFLQSSIAKFLNEAKILARFSDTPGVVHVRDCFEANHTAYIVMEYLNGHDLKHVLQNRTFSIQQALDLLHPVLEALSHLHQAGIIHRDISPDNLMILPDNGIKLMDFGAARVVDYSSQKSMSVVLKSGYAPPEQYRPNGNQGPWTDIYALCATLYKCITGTTPVDALDRTGEDGDKLRLPSELGIDIPVPQEKALMRGLSTNLKDRFQSIDELETALYHGPQSAVHSADISTPNKPARRHPPLILLAVVLFFTVALSFWASNNLDQSADPGSSVGSSGTTGTDMNTETSHVVMRSSEGLPIQDLSSDIDLIKDRLDLLVGNGNWSISEGEYDITVELPKDIFKSVDERNNWYASLFNYPHTLFLVDNRDGTEDGIRVVITSRDIDKVETKRGSSSESTWISIVFSDEFISLYDGVFFSSNSIISLQLAYASGDYINLFDLTAQRVGDSNIFQISDEFKHKTAFTDGNDIAGILESERNCNILEAFAHMLNHPLEHEFISEFYLEDIIWDQIPELVTGINLVSKDALSDDSNDDYLTIQYEISAERLTEGNLIDIYSSFTERLDTLSIPYALGTDEKNNIYVMISPNYINLDIISLLCQQFTSNSELRTSLSSTMLYNTDGVESFIDNSHHLNIKFPRNWSHLYNRFMQISEETNSPALLYVCGYPLLSVQTPSASSDRTMTFDYPGAYPIELYDSLINGTEIPSDIFFSVGTCCYNDIPFDPESDPSIYGVESIIDDDINKLKNSFKENCDTAEIRKFSRKHGSISINLHLYPDSGLPNRGLNTVQSILKDLSFQGSSIISLDFYLSSSTSSQDAICKISFKKNISDHSYYDSDVTDGTISVSAEIHGGVFTDYQQQFQEVYNNSEFFSQYGDVEWVFDAE